MSTILKNAVQCVLFARQNLLLASSQVIKESKTTLGYLCSA